MSGWACGCTSQDCREFGCQCDPANVARLRAARGHQCKPHGCVCPPGSEATCQGIACPRRRHPGSASGGGPGCASGGSGGGASGGIVITIGSGGSGGGAR